MPALLLRSCAIVQLRPFGRLPDLQGDYFDIYLSPWVMGTFHVSKSEAGLVAMFPDLGALHRAGVHGWPNE